MKTAHARLFFCALLLALGLFVSQCTHAADPARWSALDKSLFAAYVAESAYDAAQTDQCLHAQRCTETNPVLGSHPTTARLIGTKAIVGGALYWLADSFPQQRTLLLGIGNVLEISVIAHNASIGMNVKF
jgi:hypothetical protein